ncbi:MAG: ClbS/DfsB family four-helix bundle protein, partial [Candidatus Heimdallarchaeota archaeon]|nr:ClbS/DfsB family four-helix bundle protein [Candidatus Heimdallarchaeota archaeon]
EQRLIGWAKIGISGNEPDDFPTNMDEVNAMNEESSLIDKKKPLSVVMQEFSESFPETVKAVEAIPPEMLEDLEYFEWRKAPFWVIVAADTWWHYKEHQEDLHKSLEEFKNNDS